MAAIMRAASALVAVLLLSACLVTPGKFVSTLDIRADRSFTFTYKGEIIASDMGKSMGGKPGDAADDPIGSDTPGQKDSAYQPILWQESKTPAPEEPFTAASGKDDEAQMQAIAAALLKEKGFRAARYMGNHRFEIDYAIEGRLTHAFLFPFNSDAQIVLPFVAVELRGTDRVRVKAPGYSNGFDKSQSPMGGSGSSDDAAKALDGVFTLTTDAEIVSQNQEEGAQTTPRGKQIVWKVTPLTNEAPTATLRIRP